MDYADVSNSLLLSKDVDFDVLSLYNEYVCAWVCEHVKAGTLRVQENNVGSLGLAVVSCPIWVLGIEFRSSAKEVHTPKN